MGAAASSGIPEVARLALKLGASFTILGTVKEAIEVFKPDHVVVVSRDYGEPVVPEEYASKLLERKGRIMLVFGGIDPAPSKDVAGLGDAIYPANTRSRLGPIAEAALILYPIARISQGTA
ncbi:RecB-family nuclease [Hyperthermus butylicus]|uniref:Conserved crenarchaeal protein n=1 Tax=Hyperthermus butylicus (strain DSM 5456 / JCM 9403 / PLM1-5) TaxID=415426 RepID=A2BLW0_HYPBU|nr:RecB-family nuclease [Hyperthermus butylicus]ABM80971.1 conserved crenarchaeal protein [Hyperthermus butylicus DSM 5456]